MTNPIPSIRSTGAGSYTKYVLTMTMTYCLVYFTVDSAGFFNIGTMSVRILASTVLTFLMLLALAGIVSWNSSGSRK